MFKPMKEASRQILKQARMEFETRRRLAIRDLCQGCCDRGAACERWIFDKWLLGRLVREVRLALSGGC